MKTVDWENLKNQLAQASGSQHLSKSLNQSTRPMDCQPKPTLKYGVLALGSYSILKMWIGCQHFKIRKFHTKNPASSFSLDKLENLTLLSTLLVGQAPKELGAFSSAGPIGPASLVVACPAPADIQMCCLCSEWPLLQQERYHIQPAERET